MSLSVERVCLTEIKSPTDRSVGCYRGDNGKAIFGELVEMLTLAVSMRAAYANVEGGFDRADGDAVCVSERSILPVISLFLFGELSGISFLKGGQTCVHQATQ